MNKDSTNKVYVGNIPFSITEQELQDFFKDCGEIVQVNVVKDRDTGRPRGFAFVTFASAEGAESATKLDGHDCSGRQLKINPANPSTGGGGGGARGGRGDGGGRGGDGFRGRDRY
jgi:cold-inducible RNA-binding protein